MIDRVQIHEFYDKLRFKPELSNLAIYNGGGGVCKLAKIAKFQQNLSKVMSPRQTVTETMCVNTCTAIAPWSPTE